MTKTCPHMSSCNMYPIFSVQALLKVWKVQFCESNYETCARFERSKQGAYVPPNMLPNGQVLPIVGKT